MSNGTGRFTNKQLYETMEKFGKGQVEIQTTQATIQGDVAYIKEEVSKLNGHIEKNTENINDNKVEIVGNTTALKFIEKGQDKVEKRLFGIIKDGIVTASVVLLILQEIGKANGWW